MTWRYELRPREGSAWKSINTYTVKEWFDDEFHSLSRTPLVTHTNEEKA